MENKVTIDSIMAWYKNAIENREPISAGKWLDGAAKLTILKEELDEKWIAAKMHLNEFKAALLEEGKKANHAEIIIQSTPAYKEYLLLDAQRERLEEAVRIAKKRCELKEWEN